MWGSLNKTLAAFDKLPAWCFESLFFLLSRAPFNHLIFYCWHSLQPFSLSRLRLLSCQPGLGDFCHRPISLLKPSARSWHGLKRVTSAAAGWQNWSWVWEDVRGFKLLCALQEEAFLKGHSPHSQQYLNLRWLCWCLCFVTHSYDFIN